jgi:hypothetical protein
MRKGIDRKAVFETRSVEFTRSLVRWLGAEERSEIISEMRARLDAVLRFTAFVVNQFLERNYALENHGSDVLDQFQLHYLALDGFVIVSNDRAMWNRTAGSPQASRIMSFEDFLRTL